MRSLVVKAPRARKLLLGGGDEDAMEEEEGNNHYRENSQQKRTTCVIIEGREGGRRARSRRDGVSFGKRHASGGRQKNKNRTKSSSNV